MTTPGCHPEKRHYAKGLCASCYKKMLYRSNPTYRTKAKTRANEQYAKEPEPIRQRVARYRAKNIERIRAYDVSRGSKPHRREERKARRAFRRQFDEAYRVRESAKTGARMMARYQKDPTPFITRSMHQRARRAGAPGSHTDGQWRRLVAEHQGKCVYCGVVVCPDWASGDIKALTRDHKTPLIRGGTNDIDNIVPACRPCNLQKHDKSFDEFKQLLDVRRHLAGTG